MPINATGDFERELHFTDDREAGAGIMRSDLDAALDDVAVGISEALSRASEAMRASRYSVITLPTISDVVSDASLSYAAGSAGTVTPEDMVCAALEQISYSVMPSTSTGYDVITAGGVKLLANRSSIASYVSKSFRTKAALLADPLISYSASVIGKVSPGDAFTIPQTLTRFIVADHDATDHDAITASGVKLYEFTIADTIAETVPLHRALFSDLAALTPDRIALGGRVVVFALGGTVFERVASGGDLDYSASGGVRLSVLASTSPIPVEAFGAVQASTAGVYTDSAAALQKALNWSAAGIGRSVYFSGDYAISATLVMPVAASVHAHRNAILRPLPGGGPSIGIIAMSGSMLGWTCLPQLHQFSAYGTSIRGTDLAHIYIPECHSCGCAIQLAATVSDKNILNTTIEFDAISNCGAVVEIYSETSDCVIQGISIRGNFVTEATTFLRRTGVGCSDDGPEINMIAIDFTHGGGAFCDNQIAGHVVPRPSARIGTWLGGIGLLATIPTQIFKGQWNGAQMDFCDAQIFDERHLTPDLVAGSSWRIRAGLALGEAVTLVPLGTALSGFNGGHMLCQTVFLAKLTLAAPLAAGATFGASFFHCLADGSYQHFNAMLQQGATGVIVEAVHDQSATVAGRVAVSLRNVTAAAIPAGTTIYIAVRRD